MLLTENRNYPYEGYFWFIDGSVVGITAEVPQYNYSYELNGKTHRNTWSSICSDYKVDGVCVPWDYFPRGRVMVDPNYDPITGKFIDYSCMVFLDKCINNDACKKLIAEYYNLYVPAVHSIVWSMLSERAGIDHYKCHWCDNT